MRVTSSAPLISAGILLGTVALMIIGWLLMRSARRDATPRSGHTRPSRISYA